VIKLDDGLIERNKLITIPEAYNRKKYIGSKYEVLNNLHTQDEENYD